MTNKDNEKLILPPEATQSSYDRVLEWKTQTEGEGDRDTAFKRRPGSVPNDEHRPEGLGSLRDDMALPHRTDAHYPFDVIGFEQWVQHGGAQQMAQGKANFVHIDEVQYVKCYLGNG
jgi:hypothetical protein